MIRTRCWIVLVFAMGMVGCTKEFPLPEAHEVSAVGGGSAFDGGSVVTLLECAGECEMLLVRLAPNRWSADDVASGQQPYSIVIRGKGMVPKRGEVRLRTQSLLEGRVIALLETLSERSHFTELERDGLRSIADDLASREVSSYMQGLIARVQQRAERPEIGG